MARSAVKVDGSRAPVADRPTTHPQTVTDPARRGRTRKALETRRRILEAAVEVLRREGHAGFSIPRVAREAGVFQGNVTYYYPTRVALLEAVTGHILGLYEAEFAGLLTDLDPARKDWAERLIGWMLDDAISEANVRLSPELWSIANRHDEAAGTVCRLYDDGVAMIVRSLGHDPSDPRTGPLRAVLYAVIAAVEGTTAIHGHRAPGDPVFRSARAAILTLTVPALAEAHAALHRGR